MNLRLFSKCRCGQRLPARSAENATYVLDGRPVCSFDCYVQFGFGPESDWDCPPTWPQAQAALAP
ncbi:MAG TPA: hypothetical protein VNU25_01155 [Candidatus Paceibacterota bacterium]|nr:hypothetical protein [Candidatus Paceibacterota bacterium]